MEITILTPWIFCKILLVNPNSEMNSKNILMKMSEFHKGTFVAFYLENDIGISQIKSSVT